MTKNPFFKVIK